MKYELIKATTSDTESLINYKLNTIFEYAFDLSELEKDRIINYVKEKIPQELKNYKLIKVNNKQVGCLLISNYEDGLLIDEIFIEKEYRSKGIGSSILEEITKKKEPLYLWVYKENKQAIKLYTKYNFKIIDEIEPRYFMKRN